MVATVPSMIGQFNMDNIRILQGMGCEVDVAADFTDASVWPSERVAQFKNQMEDMGIQCLQLDFSRNPLRLGCHIRSYREVKQLLRSRRYKLVHTHTPIASAIVRLAARRERRRDAKVIYTAHGFHFYDGAPIRNWLLYFPVEWLCSWWTDVLVTINREDHARASRRLRARRAVLIPGVGVDTERFSSCYVDVATKRRELGVGDDDFLLLSVGELSDRKNQRVVIEALARMRAAGTLGDVVYLAVGTGELDGEFHQLVGRYGLDGHVRLLGFRRDVAELCKTVDCFVHPSVREGLGIAPLEAMAAGLPLISANVNGIRDYTEDGVSGCCVDPTDVGAMAEAIERMRDDGKFRERCASNNSKVAKAYDVRKTNEVMREVYQAVLRPHHGLRAATPNHVKLRGRDRS